MKTPKSFFVLMILSLIGVGVSVYLSQHYYQVHAGTAGFKSMCNMGQTMNCDAVAASTYAELFAGIPLSSLATGWFLGIIAVAALGLGAAWRRVAARLLMIMGGVALLTSLFYLFIMIAVVKTYCLFCLILDAINALIFGTALTLRPVAKGEGASTTEESSAWKTMLGTIAACIFVAVVATKGMDQSNYSHADVDLIAQSVLNAPPLPVGADPQYTSIGAPNAPITIVEFSDFQCPFCRMAAMQMNTLLDRYAGKVRVVFRNFPLDQSCNSEMKHPLHEVACEAARVAYCANKQGKFKEVYENIYENQTSLAPGKPLEFAKQAGADPAQIEACVKDPATNAAIQNDIEEAKRLQIQSTPTIFVNGRKIDTGMPPLPVWDKIIPELAK